MGRPIAVERKFAAVDLIDILFETIDMRSFSNLWFWIALSVLWSSASHWVIGVPHDMIHRARREGGQSEVDLSDLVRVNVNRLLNVIDHSLYVIVGMGAFWLTFLAILGFFYQVEFAQAVFLLIAPMSVVIWRSVKVSRWIAAGNYSGEALYRQLIWHRRVTQIIGMLAVTVTALYGTWMNFNTSVLN
ncbi:hypothetical protein MCELHM10_03212 [Paracoccaceae bacterium]|jgi:hypothetical protein